MAEDFFNLLSKLFKFHPDSIKVQQNIRSQAKNFDELVIYLQSFSDKFHIMALIETWGILDLNFFKLEDDDMIFNEVKFNEKDGILLFVTSEVNSIFVMNSVFVECTSTECRLELICLEVNIAVLTVY